MENLKRKQIFNSYKKPARVAGFTGYLGKKIKAGGRI